jgi:hypothetical protein
VKEEERQANAKPMLTFPRVFMFFDRHDASSHFPGRPYKVDLCS